MRQIDFRFIIVHNGADKGELKALMESPARLRMDDTAEIKTSLSGTFAPSDDIDLLADEIRPEMILDGVVFPLGVFAPATVSEERSENSLLLKVEAYDRCWRVRDNYTETILSLAAGTNYITAAKQLLTASGIAAVLETPTTATLTEIREDWDIGTSYLEIINQLLSEINYKPLYFNSQGAAVLEPIGIPSADNIQHVFDSNNIQSLMLPETERGTDVYSAPNVFLCICSNPDKDGSLTAISVNDNPQSPLSVQRRGRRIMRVENVDNIASQAELNEYAEHLRNESMFTGEVITVSTALFPNFGVDDVVALITPDVTAICKDRNYEMELQVGGTMKHTLERVVLSLE